jgi:regulator of sigma E protease
MDFISSFATGLASFIVIMGLVVVIHEYGHYLAGRMFGAAAESFSLGFGKSVFERTDKRGTRWRINWLPLGGFVKFVGEDNPAQGQTATGQSTSRPIGKGFMELGPGQRAIIAAAGPFANFVFAALIFAGLAMAFGTPTERLSIAEVQPNSPALAAGFEVGDVLTAVDGKPLVSISDFIEVTQLSTGRAVVVDIERGSAPLTLTVTPERRTQTNDLGMEIKVGVVGLVLERSEQGTQTYGPVGALVQGTGQTADMVIIMGKALGRIVTGKEPIDQMSGPVGIADFARRVATASASVEEISLMEKIMATALSMLSLAAILSVGVGLFNLLPIPVLDGGHIVFCAVEAVAGRNASEAVQRVGMSLGLVLIVGLALVVTWNDLKRLGVLDVFGGLS